LEILWKGKSTMNVGQNTSSGQTSPSTGATSGGGNSQGPTTSILPGSGASGTTGTNSSAPPATPSDWKTGLSDDLKGFAELKQFSDPGQILDSYMNLEKLMGAPKERLLKLPEKADDPAWGDIYSKLGKPQKPEEYMIGAPEGQDDSFAKNAAKAFHDSNLSRSQADKLATWWNDTVKSQNEAQETERKTKLDGEVSALKKEWGSAYNQNVEMAKAALKTFGIKPEMVDKIEQMVGYKDVMNLMHSIGGRLGEHNFHTGGKTGSGSFGNVMTPGAAQARIKGLQQDTDFIRRLAAGGADELAEWTQLHQWASPEESEDQSA
jgi:hypothetical protein